MKIFFHSRIRSGLQPEVPPSNPQPQTLPESLETSGEESGEDGRGWVDCRRCISENLYSLIFGFILWCKFMFFANSLTAFLPERNCETSRPWKPNLPRGRSQRPSRNNWKRWDRFAFVKIQFAIFFVFCDLSKILFCQVSRKADVMAEIAALEKMVA